VTTYPDERPEFLALLAEAVQFLDDHRTDFIRQLGGGRNFGGGIVECELVDPLYNERELGRVFDRGKKSTQTMSEKDDKWASEHRPEFETALAERVEAV